MGYRTQKRSGRHRSLQPAVAIRTGCSVVNRAALELLTQEGAQYVAVIVRDDKVILKPFEMDGLVKVAFLCPTDQARAHATLGVAEVLGLPDYTRYAARWDDAEGHLEIDLTTPLKSRARRRHAA
jgi:hypothetical protein